MKTIHTVENLDQLLDAVAASGFDPNHQGNPVVEIELWDGRKVHGNYHRCEESELDVTTRMDVFIDTTPLEPFVNRLLSDGIPFVTETGSHDAVCTLQWIICG